MPGPSGGAGRSVRPFLTHGTHGRTFPVDPGRFVKRTGKSRCGGAAFAWQRSLCLRRGHVCSYGRNTLRWRARGLIMPQGRPIRGGASQTRTCQIQGHAGLAPAAAHVTARAARIRPVLSGARRCRRGLVPARCTLILHPRAARGPAPGPPASAAGAPIHRGRARQRAPPADTGGLIVRRTAALHRRDRRRTARVPPSRPDHPGADGGGRAGSGGRSPHDHAHASWPRASRVHASWLRDSWSAVRLPPFTRPPPRPSQPRASGVSEFRTE